MPEKTLQSIEDLKPADYNPRKIGKDALASLGYSLEEFGDIAGLTWNKRTGNMVCGHQRLTALKQSHDGGLKLEDGAVVTPAGERYHVRVVDWDLRKEQAANLVANNPLIGGEFLPEAAILIDEIDLEMGDLADKLKLTDLKDIIPDFELPPDTEEDQIAEVPLKPYTRTGDLWILGDHRVLCGDSREREDVERLMDGKKAVWMWTDPPYGVGYVGKQASAMTIENDSSVDLNDLLNKAFGLADSILEEGSPIYVAHPAGVLSLKFGAAFLKMGWKFHETLVWVKDSMVLGHSDYHYKHEPIIYGWKGSNRNWYGDRSQVSVAEVNRPKRSDSHPTMKPIDLIATHLHNSSRSGDIGYDPFLGSGTTLIASEKLNRICYGMEIGKGYCDVIALCWQNVTGKTPVLERDGKREEVDLKAEIEAISKEGQESEDSSIATTKNESVAKTSKKNKRQGKKSEDKGDGAGKDGGEDDEGRKWPYIAKPVRFTKEQRMVIDQAISQVRKELGDPSMTEGRCCELMAADCLAGNPSNREQIS